MVSNSNSNSNSNNVSLTGKGMQAAMNGVYQVIQTTNDANGNPRRLTLVHDVNYSYELIAVYEHGYSGDRIPMNAVILCAITVSPKEYQDQVAKAKRLKIYVH